MDGTRIADLDELSTDDTHLFRVRAVDGSGDGDGAAVASGTAALQSDESAAENADGVATPDDGVARPNGDGTDADVREAILLRLADGDSQEDGNGTGPDDGNGTGPDDAVACWLNYCQHMTHIKLDKGSGAPVRGGEVVCANHGAMFDADSGRCTYGPCEGAFLNELDVRVADSGVYLTDEDYEYVGDGPTDSDDDLSSSSNVIL